MYLLSLYETVTLHIFPIICETWVHLAGKDLGDVPGISLRKIIHTNRRINKMCKSKKKLLSSILVLILVLSSGPLLTVNSAPFDSTAAISTSDTFMIQVGNITGKPGDEIDIPIVITNNQGIAGFKFRLHFDNTKLLPISIMQGDVLHAGSITSNLQSDGDLSHLDYVTSVWASTSNITGDGVMYSVRFKIKDGTDNEITLLTVSYSPGDVINQTLDVLKPEVTQGRVEINTFIYGDIYTDGVINSKDVVRLAQYLAGWSTTLLSPAELSAADVHSDGVINSKDVVRLAQYLAGWPVTLGTQ